MSYSPGELSHPLCNLNQVTTPIEVIYINFAFVLMSFIAFYLCTCFLTFLIHRLRHKKILKN